VARVNIFLKDDLLRAIDAEAEESVTNRSALVQAALSLYLEARRKDREEAAVRRAMEEACRGMDALADRLGNWDPVRAIRESRDRRSLRVRESRGRYRATTRRKPG